MIVLGIGRPFEHDAAAAILVDGKIIAAVEEERFTRKKHAINEWPEKSIEFCIRKAKVSPSEINRIAYPWSWHSHLINIIPYIKRIILSKPKRAFKAMKNVYNEYQNRIDNIHRVLEKNGFNINKTKIDMIDHHIAHAASSYYFSGMKNAAIMSIDGSGEFVTTMFGEGKNGHILEIKKFISPDSLGFFYAAITEYLGFWGNNDEYKVMGMAAYGDPNKIDFSEIIFCNEGKMKLNDEYLWVETNKRYDPRKAYSKKLVDKWGPPRTGEGLSEPYIDIAAGCQKTFENIAINLMETYLSKVLIENNGNLCFSGGCALNVLLNNRLINHPLVNHLWVQPAANDAGTPLGAAAIVAAKNGDNIESMTHCYYGPSYDDIEIKCLLNKDNLKYKYIDDIVSTVAKMLAAGEIIGWFQGALEFGPRALGNRSILANPSLPNIKDKINAQIKYREDWRPFCPSILDSHASDILDGSHDSPFMTYSFAVKNEYKDMINQTIHVNGLTRPQIVKKAINPLFYSLIEKFYTITGIPVLLNTSLNRRKEPIVCSPQDAIELFNNSGLEYIVLNNFLVYKNT